MPIAPSSCCPEGHMSKDVAKEGARLHRAPGAQPLARALRAMGLKPRLTVVLIPYIWLALFFLVPFLIVLKISFAEQAIAQPPYSPLLVCSGPEVTSTWLCFVE